MANLTANVMRPKKLLDLKEKLFNMTMNQLHRCFREGKLVGHLFKKEARYSQNIMVWNGGARVFMVKISSLGSRGWKLKLWRALEVP